MDDDLDDWFFGNNNTPGVGYRPDRLGTTYGMIRDRGWFLLVWRRV
jgi:hypothetical protein